MRLLLAHRDARRYLGGQLLSSFGDSALWLALGIWIRTLTGSDAAAGLSFFMLAVGSLCGPFGGLLADRVRRRPLLIAVNGATAGLVLLLLLVRGPGQVWLIYTVLVGYGISGALLAPAQTALAQTLLPAELLGAANSALQAAQWGMRLVTPLLGAGLLTAFGPAPVVVGDAATFVVAIATLAALRVTERPPTPARHGLVREATAGLRHIHRTPALRRLTVATVLAVCAFGLSEPTVFAVVSQGLHRPNAFLGVLTSAQGAGAIAAGATATALLSRLGEQRLAATGLAATTCGFLLQILPAAPAVLAGAALLGAGLPWFTVSLLTLFQLRTPPALMGRTEGALTLAVTLPQTLAIALGAALIEAVGYQLLLLAIAVLTATAAVYLHARDAEPVPVAD